MNDAKTMGYETDHEWDGTAAKPKQNRCHTCNAPLSPDGLARTVRELRSILQDATKLADRIDAHRLNVRANAAEIRRLSAMGEGEPANDIRTHHAPLVQRPWLALDMDRARTLLEPSGLTPEEKISLTAMMARYCNVLDRAGLIGYGMTEEEAIANLPE